MLASGRWSISVDRLVGGCAILLAAACSSLAAQSPPSANGLTVRSVAFKGNHAIDDETLAASIATSESAWPRRYAIIRLLGLGERRTFDELEFRRDVLRVQLLYRLSGYYDARVDTTVERAPDHVNVTFRIQEGPPILVDSITIRSNDSVRTGRVLRRLPLKVGRPLDRVLFDLSADTILFAARERGYPFAAVFRNYTVDRTTRLAEVTYDVETGPRARIGAILVDTAAGVSAPLVRRFLALRVGDRFSQSALYESQRTLYQTNMFRYVAVGIAPDSLVDAVDTLVRIKVTALAGGRVQARAGVGYGTVDCFRAQATTSVADFAGGGRRLDFAGKVSKIGVGVPTSGLGLQRSLLCSALADDPFSDTLNYTASATLTQPALFSHSTSGALSVFAERRSEFKAYENVSLGGAASVAVGNGAPPGATFTYRIAQTRTIADAATFCIFFDRCDTSVLGILSSAKREATVGVALADVRTDAPIDPTKGHALTLDALTAARAVGSQLAFSKAVGQAIWYRPVTAHAVLALRIQAGAIATGLGVVQGTPIRFVPPEERFYAGGPTTVRGYGLNQMGPVVYVAADTSQVSVDAQSTVTACRSCRTSPLGSSGIVLANAELRTPSPVWPSRLRLAFFVDAGQLWEQGQGLVPSGWRVTPGAGVRVGTPLGPMRLDVGYNPYAPQCGPVYAVNGTSLQRMGTSDYCPPRTPGILHRLTFQFSVGQPY